MEFRPFQKISRLSREMIVTEKIDGTNASIYITPIAKTYWDDKMLLYFYGPDCSTWGVYAASRTRWITPEDDNFGFAAWVVEHWPDLKVLGPGHHFGEWWGKGIQRGYGLEERRFSLFNVNRWSPDNPPACCSIVPVLYRGVFYTLTIDTILEHLRERGSIAAPGFPAPEGVVVFHAASGMLFKKTCEHDDEPKNAHPKKEREPQQKRKGDPAQGGRRVAVLPISFPDRRGAV